MIHVIIGAPCSGKSTYVQEHKADGDLVVDYDLIAKALGASDHLPEGHIRKAAFAAREAVISYALSNECEAWIIHTSPTEEQRAAYEAAGAEFIELETDLETCPERAEQDNRPPGTEEHIRDFFAAEGKGATMRTKSFKAELDGGIVRGYASTFDREPDSYGDVIAKGAFAKTLESWQQKNAEGHYIPLLWGHDVDNPESNIGRIIEATEDERGLLVVGEFDPDNERAQYVRKLAMEGRVYQFSFAFEVKSEGVVTLEDGTKANELRELELFEVSIVQIPANQHATIEEVKAYKSGRRNSKADAEELRGIADAAQGIIDTINGLLADDEGEPTDGEDGGEEQSEGQKSQAEFVSAYKEAIKAMLGGSK